MCQSKTFCKGRKGSKATPLKDPRNACVGWGGNVNSASTEFPLLAEDHLAQDLSSAVRTTVSDDFYFGLFFYQLRGCVS